MKVQLKMRLLAVLLLGPLTCAAVSALTAPSCTLKQDEPCVGHTIGSFEQGSSVEEILSNLNNTFCGCVYVRGSILINMLNINISRQLEPDDFNMFYHLREVSGVVRFLGIPNITEIVIPDLRIIRAEDLVASQYSLLVEQSTIGRLVLPRLTQISRGDVFFRDTGRLCNYLTVQWTDIIDRGGQLVDEADTCRSLVETVPNAEDLLPDCSGCGSRHCWTEEHCQTLTKNCSGCGEDRCYAVLGGGPTKQCCNPHCAAGCDGPTATHCSACKNFNNNGTCVSQCPPEVVYDRSLFRVVPNPDFRLSLDNLCVEECPLGFLVDRGSCVRECPLNHIVSEDGRECVPCNGPCPRECAGLDNLAVDVISGANIERFRGCTIITSGSILIGFVSNFDYTQLEALSTIEEIRGPVRIQGLPASVTSFPYLRNLRRIDTTNSSVKLVLGCALNELDPYALEILQNDFDRIDLSSLEEIRGDGLRYALNSNLCYVGNLTTYLTGPGDQKQCISQERRIPEECNECHAECSSRHNCWGPQDHQCDSCSNYQYKNRCVSNCSVVIVTLPEDSPGLYQNQASNECQSCDQECVGGCNGGTGPENCVACRNFFIEVNESKFLCLPSCPVGTYLVNGTSECSPCHEGCGLETGCAGPLPYLDLDNGCLDCNRVVLHRNGTQNFCVERFCPDGSYPSTLQLDVQSDPSLLGDLQLGSDICLPCDEVCEVCEGEGDDVITCPRCLFARSGDQCVRGCDPVTEYLQSGSKFCAPCASECNGCTGPTVDSCLQCAPGFFRSIDDDQSGFSCLSECGQRQFSVEGVCVDCDPRCDQCVGGGSTNCTSCTDTRFGTPLPTTGPGGERLLECFICQQNQTLNFANKTCVPSFSTELLLSGPTIAGVIVGILFLLVVATAVVFVAGFIRRRWCVGTSKITDLERSEFTNPTYGNSGNVSLGTLQPPKVAPNQARLIVTPESALEFGEVLGTGAFGTVYEGYWKPENDPNRYHVAIKVLNDQSSNSAASKELLQEGVVMASMDHDNVVRLYAVSMGKELMLISQFVAMGSLLSYLKKNKNSLDAHTMLIFAVQMAKGMEYLEEKRMVHRDLAARNVLVQSSRCVKITDFGLTRIIDVGESHYQAQGGKVPVRWMAPESLRMRVYTHKSDVWSYGVTVWEVLNFGARPYGSKGVRELVKGVEAGERLEQPPTCTIEVYAVLLECWLRDPEARPPFSELVQRLDVFLQDPLRYILTTQDGRVSDYNDLPSNILQSGEFNYENHSFTANTLSLSQDFPPTPLSPHPPHTLTAPLRGGGINPYTNGTPSPNYEADPNLQQSFAQLEASASQYGSKTAPLYTNGATPHVAPISPNLLSAKDKRYVSAPKLDDMGQDTLSRTTLPRPLGDLPDDGEYVMAAPPPSEELVPGNAGYDYLDMDGQRMLLKLQSGPTDVTDNIPISAPLSRPRRPSDYEIPVSPVTNSQSDDSPLLSRGNYDFDENFKAQSMPRYYHTPSNGLSNTEPIEEYDEPLDYDEQPATQEYAEIDDPEPGPLEREYSEIDDEFNEISGYSAIPQDFQAPPPAKKAPPPAKQAPTLNGRDLKLDVFETLTASDLDTTDTPSWRMRSRTFTTPPREEYETPVDATTTGAGFRGHRAHTMQATPPPTAQHQLLDNYETPIDAA